MKETIAARIVNAVIRCRRCGHHRYVSQTSARRSHAGISLGGVWRALPTPLDASTMGHEDAVPYAYHFCSCATGAQLHEDATADQVEKRVCAGADGDGGRVGVAPVPVASLISFRRQVRGGPHLVAHRPTRRRWVTLLLAAPCADERLSGDWRGQKRACEKGRHHFHSRAYSAIRPRRPQPHHVGPLNAAWRTCGTSGAGLCIRERC